MAAKPIQHKFLVRVALISLHTKTSGDLTGEGQFYLNVNGVRFPSQVLTKLEGIN